MYIDTCICICMCICIYVYTYMCIYIYIEREREIMRMYLYLYMYVCVYIYIFTQINSYYITTQYITSHYKLLYFFEASWVTSAGLRRAAGFSFVGALGVPEPAARRVGTFAKACHFSSGFILEMSNGHSLAPSN